MFCEMIMSFTFGSDAMEDFLALLSGVIFVFLKRKENITEK